MELKDYAELKALENGHDDYDKHRGKGWSIATAVWVIAAVIVLAFVFWGWQKGCSEKMQIAVGMAKLDGRVDAIEPVVTAHGNNLYSLNGVLSATVQGVGDLKENTNFAINRLEHQVLFADRGRSGCGCGCGNREFRQSSVYNLASQQVTVDETCRNG